MFPLNSNMPYIKDNGERDKLGNIIGSGGGGSELPAHTAADAGKVLTVNETGGLTWSSFSSDNRYVSINKPAYIYPNADIT